MAKQSFKIDGMQEAFKILDNLPDSLRSKFLQASHRNTLNQVMKKPSPIEEDTKVTTERGHPNAMLFGIPANKFWYRFIEYGTSLRTRKKKGSTGKMNAEPFFQRYVDAKIKQVVRHSNENYSDLMEKWLKRRIKSTGKRIAKL